MFCKNCGKEVADNAYVCTGCGYLVNDGARNAVSANEGVKTGKGSLLLKIFLMISFAFFCCTLFWGAEALAFALVGYDRSSYATRLYLDNVFVVSMLIFSLINCGLAIVAFIFGMKEKQQPALKMLAILNFMLAITALLIAIAFMLSIA